MNIEDREQFIRELNARMAGWRAKFGISESPARPAEPTVHADGSGQGRNFPEHLESDSGRDRIGAHTDRILDRIERCLLEEARAERKRRQELRRQSRKQGTGE